MRGGDIKRLGLSASPSGRPIVVDSEVVPVHVISSMDSADAVYLTICNVTPGALECELILSPVSSATVDVNAAAIPVSIPAKARELVLAGHEVRVEVGAPYQIAIRVTGAADADTGLRAFGYAVRRKGPAETP